jgi:tRNA splicing endonuclease
MGRIIDETGNRYGRLTVVRRNPENAYHKGANWICRCECGGERVASGIGLRQGLIKSCGCLIRETRVLRCACGYKGQKTRNWTPDWKCYRCSGASPLQEPPKMTEDEIFEKRAEHWRFYHRSAPTSASHDVMLFLERLEKVTKERDMAVEQHRLSQHEVARWVDRETKAVRERDEARAEVERLRELLDENAYERGLLARRMTEAQARRDEAYRRGAEAMRDECIGAACGFYMGTTGFCNGDEDDLEAVLEALPIPEEPTNG